MKTYNQSGVLGHAAMKAGIDPKTARRYLRAGQGPQELKPVWLAGGGSAGLGLLAGSAAAVSAVFVLLGLAVGCWIKDGVTGLIVAVALWFGLLYGVDLLLLGVAGAPWWQARPEVFVGCLMANPLDAFRVGVLFAVEQAAFSGLAAGRLAGWWQAHPALWLGIVCGVWSLVLGAIAWLGARRPLA